MSELSISQPIRFQALILSIQVLDQEMRRRTKVAVNVNLTMRNWVIGYYIDSYELNGEDRSDYGEGLIPALSSSLEALGLPTVGRRQLYSYLAFYRTFPHILRIASPPSLDPLKEVKKDSKKKVRTVSAQSLDPLIIEGINDSKKKVRTVSAQLKTGDKNLLKRLSYSHFELLFQIEKDAKRDFYQEHCLQGRWSVRELKRQITSLYYERTALSKNKAKLQQQTERNDYSGLPIAPAIVQTLAMP